jgi:hypothetical protein
MDKVVKKLIEQASSESRGITVLNTPEQLRLFYTNHVSKYKTWRAIASIEDWLPVDQNFLQDFRRQLDDAGVETKVIFKQSGLTHEQDGYKHRQVKTVPDDYKFKSSIDVLDDKILIMNPHQAVLGLVIESAILVDVFIDMFDILWDQIPTNN